MIKTLYLKNHEIQSKRKKKKKKKKKKNQKIKKKKKKKKDKVLEMKRCTDLVV